MVNYFQRSVSRQASDLKIVATGKQITGQNLIATMDHSAETTPVPLYRGLDVRPFEFGAAAATAEL